MADDKIKNVQLDFIPGLPPSQPQDDAIQGKTDKLVRNSMPIVRIYPGIPSFTKGATLFTRKDYFEGEGDKTYSSLLLDHGFSLSPTLHNKCLTLSYIADSFPSDNFSNEYGENFLQSITDVTATTAASIAQMLGVRTLGEASERASALAKEMGFENIGNQITGGTKKVNEVVNKVPGGSSLSGLASAIALNGRLDFPMIWKSSVFQPSYTMTVRLYNPNPGSKAMTEKYIAGPVAAILLLALPISPDNDGYTYQWPFIHKIWSPGIYDLDPAFISNVAVIKGGDQQQIGFTQRLGIVDVRIDFGSLFSSMIVSKSGIKTRPTLKKYIEGISGKDSQKNGVERLSDLYGASNDQNNEALQSEPSSTIKSKIINAAFETGKKVFSDTVQIVKDEALDSVKNRRLPSFSSIKSATTNAGIRAAKSQAQKVEDLTDDQLKDPTDRVNQTIKNIADELVKKFPSGL